MLRSEVTESSRSFIGIYNAKRPLTFGTIGTAAFFRATGVAVDNALDVPVTLQAKYRFRLLRLQEWRSLRVADIEILRERIDPPFNPIKVRVSPFPSWVRDFANFNSCY